MSPRVWGANELKPVTAVQKVIPIRFEHNFASRTGAFSVVIEKWYVAEQV